MVFDFIIGLLNNFINSLPTFADNTFVQYIAGFISHFSTVNYYLPCTEILVFCGFMLAFYSARGIFYIIKWIASRFVI